MPRSPDACKALSLSLPLFLAAISLALPSPALAACPALPPAAAETGSETLDPAFASNYFVWRLPVMTGDATNAYPGGMAIDLEDPDIFYIIDNTEGTTTQLLRVRVLRDACGHVTGWDGDATKVASIPYGDANLLHAPNETFLFSEWPQNTLGQVAGISATTPPSTTWTTAMGPLGVATSGSGTAGLTFVPRGYTAPGTLMTMTWGGDLYSVPYTTDSTTGQLTFSPVTHLASLPNGPGGITFVPAGSPVLNQRGMLVLEYSNDSVAYYPADSSGTPDVSSRVEVLSQAAGAWGGGFVDPISGDLYWSAWAGDQQIHVISGFSLPECAADIDCHTTQWCSPATNHCEAKLANGVSIPSEAGHTGAPLTGVCTPGAAASVCASHVCAPSNNKCGLTDGAACSSTADCQTSTCDNSLCGGVVLNPNACTQDTDCSAANYCNAETDVCEPRLGSGQPVPAGHGVCNGASGQLGDAVSACASGQCNAATNTCSAKNLEPCDEAADCTSNACGQDGKCGKVDGSACNDGLVCRSACVNGKCAASEPAVLSSGCSASGSGPWSALALLAVALFLVRRQTRHLGLGRTGLFLVLGFATAAEAQTSGAAIDVLRPAAAGSDWFSTDSLDLRGTVRPSVRVMVDWAHDPLVVRSAGGTRIGTPLQNQLTFNAGAALNLFDRVRLFANLPIAAYQNGFDSRLGGVELRPTASGGLGDFAYGADVRLWGEYQSPVTVAVGVAATAPTGSARQLLGDGRSNVMPRALVAGQSGIFVWAAQLGFNFRRASISYVQIENELRAAASVGVRLGAQGEWMVGPEAYAIIPVGQHPSGRTGGVEGDLGAHYRINDQWKVGAGVGTALERSIGFPDVRVLGMVDWQLPLPSSATPRRLAVDLDGDGLPDGEDSCPLVAGPAANHGCPADADSDGVPDADDACPTTPRGDTPDAKRVGCPAPPPDQDGDGVPDSMDQCPKEAPGTHPDSRRSGCPLPDRDADGIPDDQDACPDEAGAASANPKKSGCASLVDMDSSQIRIRKSISFAENSDRLVGSSDEVLAAVADILSAHPELARVSVEGHTDLKGKPEYNKRLSERRAQAVMRALVKDGVAPTRLEAHGMGSTRPLIPKENMAEDGAVNRRVEFHIVKTAKP